MHDEFPPVYENSGEANPAKFAEPDFLYRNDGGTLVKETSCGTADGVALTCTWNLVTTTTLSPSGYKIHRHTRRLYGSGAAAFGDFDGDGWLDLFVVDMAHPESVAGNSRSRTKFRDTDSALYKNIQGELASGVTYAGTAGTSPLTGSGIQCWAWSG